jgi:hypothetical protein
LQVETSFSMPPVHDAVPHEVAVVALWHARLSVPLHDSPQVGSVVVALHAGWPVFGWPTIGVQVPSLPETLHASHEPVHELLQQ